MLLTEIAIVLSILWFFPNVMYTVCEKENQEKYLQGPDAEWSSRRFEDGQEFFEDSSSPIWPMTTNSEENATKVKQLACQPLSHHREASKKSPELSWLHSTFQLAGPFRRTVYVW